MSIAPASRPLGAASLPAAVGALRAHGLRVTAARRLVLEALFAASEPVGAEAIARGLDGRLPASDLASVYRNLETLESIGLVRHVHLGHGPGRYALAGRGGWAACERCGRHAPVPPGRLARIRAVVREATGLEAGFDHFPLVGLCARCAVTGAAR
jgi:Fur family ferric uptake transcriptional regulator